MTVIQQFANTDLFSDEDGSQGFGYEDPVTGEVSETNGKWDRDKEIFFQSHNVSLSGTAGDAVKYGERCDPSAADAQGRVPCTALCDSANPQLCGTPDGGDTGYCREVTPGVFLSKECTDLKLNKAMKDGEYYATSLVFADDNGNMFSPGFEATYSVSANLVNINGEVSGALREAPPYTLDTYGGGQRNQDRPWCEEFPNLGSPVFDVEVSLNCLLVTLPVEEPPNVTVTFAASENESATVVLPQEIDVQNCADVLSSFGDTGETTPP
jgi:hypothetical protein